MDAQMLREGLLLPKEYIKGFGEIEIIRTEHYILVKPKNMTQQLSGFVTPAVDIPTLLEDYEDSNLDQP